MPDNFTRIPIEEQERILEACITEFARHGFTQASTNAIIQRAGIPKGTLFYYFGSKKALYLHVIDRAVARYMELSAQAAGDPPGDLFERLLYFGQLRLRFAQREPMLYQLFFNAFINTPPEIRAELQARFAGYTQDSAQMLFANLDRSPFREGVVVEKVVEMVMMMMEGLYARYQAQWQQMEPKQTLESIEALTEEVRGYFEMMKEGVYKG